MHIKKRNIYFSFTLWQVNVQLCWNLIPVCRSYRDTIFSRDVQCEVAVAANEMQFGMLYGWCIHTAHARWFVIGNTQLHALHYGKSNETFIRVHRNACKCRRSSRTSGRPCRLQFTRFVLSKSFHHFSVQLCAIEIMSAFQNEVVNSVSVNRFPFYGRRKPLIIMRRLKSLAKSA